MKNEPPPSPAEQFEAELVRRFFHPQSYFYQCLNEYLAGGDNSLFHHENKKMPVILTDFFMKLTREEDAYIAWQRLVRQKSFESAGQFLSKRIYWLWDKKPAGEQLKQSIRNISLDFIKIFSSLLQEKNARDDINKYLPPGTESSDLKNDFQTEIISTPESRTELTEKSRAEYSLKEDFSNPLFAQFKDEIQRIISNYSRLTQPMKPGNPSGKLLKTIRQNFTELKELSMIQGLDIIEDLSSKLLNLMEIHYKLHLPFTENFTILSSNIIIIISRFLDTELQEKDIREIIKKISDFQNRITQAQETGSNLSDEALTPISVQLVSPPEQSLEDEMVQAFTPKKDMSRNTIGDSTDDDDLIELDNIIDSSFSTEKKNVDLQDAAQKKLENIVSQVRTVPDEQLNLNFREKQKQIQAKNPQVNRLDMNDFSLTLPGEDDVELKDLINDILHTNQGKKAESLQKQVENVAIISEDDDTLTNTIKKITGISTAIPIEKEEIKEVKETDLFKSEATLYLRIIEDALNKLKERPHESTFLEDIELSAYSLKRLALKMGLESLSRLPELIETYMVSLAQKNNKLSIDVLRYIQEAINFLQEFEIQDKDYKSQFNVILSQLNGLDKQSN